MIFSKKIKQLTITALLFLGFTASAFAAIPADGLYTFINATENPDGTATTADGFFTVIAMDGSESSNYGKFSCS